MTPDWTETTPGAPPLIDPAGKSWTLVANGDTHLDGVRFSDWNGSKMTCAWPFLYVFNGAWFKCDPATGAHTPTADPRPTTPAPAPPPVNYAAEILALQQQLLNTTNTFLDWQRTQFNALPPELTPRQRIALDLAKEMVKTYFTTNTNTTQSGWDTDAATKAGRFEAALKQAVARTLAVGG